MKLATTTGDFNAYTQTQTESLEHIKNAGFKYADYSFSADYRRKDGVYSENYEEYFDKINNDADRIGIKLVQAHSPMGKPLLDVDKTFLADTIRCVDACGAWGIPNLVIHSGYVAGLTPDETYAKNKEFFAPILERAEKYGTNILIENFNKMYVDGLFWVDNATDLLAIIEHINHPLCHAIWDVGHANLQEMPQNEELKILGDHLKALHIHDNMGDKDTHLTPFLGTTNYGAVMNGLFDIGYKGYFTFEVGGFFAPAKTRRVFEQDSRLMTPPIELRDAFERYLYDLGKCILEKYNCFEE